MVTSTAAMLCPSHVWDARVGHGAVTTLGKECKVGFVASQRLSSTLDPAGPRLGCQQNGAGISVPPLDRLLVAIETPRGTALVWNEVALACWQDTLGLSHLERVPLVTGSCVSGGNKGWLGWLRWKGSSCQR